MLPTMIRGARAYSFAYDFQTLFNKTMALKRDRSTDGDTTNNRRNTPSPNAGQVRNEMQLPFFF